MVTLKEKIAGLYIAFFNRAPDKNGLEYWQDQAVALGEESAVKTLASGFAAHAKFNSLYGSMNNQEFVQAIYKNILGQAGDSDGVAYWTDLIENGLSKSDMVANFISLSLDFNPNDIQYKILSQADINAALQRQAYITNKVTASLHFTDTLGSLTNLDPSTDPNNISSLDADPAYKASINIISNITFEKSTLNDAIEGIDMLSNRDDAINILESIAVANPKNISLALDEDAPLFTSAATAGAINENSGGGQVVYTATADDESSVVYGLADVADSSRFNIDPDSGAVTLLDNPDFESKSAYAFRVVATDTSGNSSQKDITLSINDLDENAPGPSYTNLSLGTLSDENTYGVSALDSGTHWDNLRTTITYSFNTSVPNDYYDYEDGNTLTNGWTELNTAQENAINSIFDGLESLLNISFVETADNNGMIRLNIVNMDAGTDGFAFYPGDNPTYAGDVFLSSTFNSDLESHGLQIGENGWDTMAHEIGHALGLKHPFEGNTTLPTNVDDTNHTIMSYTLKDDYVPIFTITNNGNNKSIEATPKIINSQLYSLYDVAALQSIYGVNDATSTSNDIYTMQYTDYKIETIWDAGGEDTLDFSSNTGVDTIDLNPGSINSIDQYSLSEIINFQKNKLNDSDFNDFIQDFITNDLDATGLLYTGKNDFSIATGTIIENLKTGSASDVITDNMVNNSIYTFDGNDKIHLGNGGYDYIDGGNGNDSVYLDLTQNSVDISLLNNGTYDLLAKDNSFQATLVGIESVYFSDGFINL